ncbi:hypothetical protein B0A50_01415 [Salinomyces thailandicus]|uniref:Ubiquitin carboxyl-terminal hydrolase n=1 Tax=Salinomyces thailandicus TaxID=706561 RepID=A0A4U0UAJ1_9PEZI|nr:hypothetical protein B0A50_01415 [Salinomyces thailandica]
MATTTLTPTPATETPKLVKKLSSDANSPSTPVQTSFGCTHIKALLQAARDRATEGYARIVRSIHAPPHSPSNLTTRTHKTASNTIETTGEATYLCLQCSNVSNTREKHRKDHPFSIESTAGFVYCHDCRDFVYDPTFEEIRTNNINSRKRKHTALQSEDRKLVAGNTSGTPCAATGLRGLYNMGQTCFMSVVLQSLIHNPLIRNWYLSEGHKREECEREACTSCALDDIFTDFYGQEKHEGYGAVHMLQGCWKGGGGLAGYSQQDAHEFLGFFLNSLHNATFEDDDDEGRNKDAKNCDCIVHQAFGGMMRSTVTCTNCKTTTGTSDPFMDLSLDIRQATVGVKKKKLPLTNGTTTVRENLPMDLTEALDRFTSAETLSADEYRCRKCDSAQEARKRLRLERLPPVMPIHLKRFSHSKTLKESTKVDTRVRFPLALDLAPYTTAAKKAKSNKPQANGSGGKAGGASQTNNKEDDENVDKAPAYTISEPVYELNSVVVHKGKIDNGHYVNYSRQGGEWFRFDDSMVVQVDERDVLGAEAYMLFYVARTFEI